MVYSKLKVKVTIQGLGSQPLEIKVNASFLATVYLIVKWKSVTLTTRKINELISYSKYICIMYSLCEISTFI